LKAIRILVDYDDEPVADFWDRLACVTRALHARVEYVSVERSTNGGYHYTVSMRVHKLPLPAIVAIQAILGSDPYREAHNLRRALCADSVDPDVRHLWNVLFEVKLWESET
jgi:hypothetical protein